MNDDLRIEVADPDGVFLTLNREEASRLLAELRDDPEPLSPNLVALRDQLSEWVDPEETST